MTKASSAAIDAVLDPSTPALVRPKTRAEQARDRTNAILDSLPDEVRRERLLPTPATLKFVNVSAAQWRRLRGLGLAPDPVQIGLRAQAYRLGDLIDWAAAGGVQRKANVA